MTAHSFELYFDCPVADMDSPEGLVLLDSLVEAGLDDATFIQTNGKWMAYVDREADLFVDAVMTSITHVETVHNCVVQRVLPDDLVSIADIAKRCGRTRQWANQLANGTRGDGSFPEPFDSGGSGARWRWRDIEVYFEDGSSPDTSIMRIEASFLELLNAALLLRSRSRQLAQLEHTETSQRAIRTLLKGELDPAA